MEFLLLAEEVPASRALDLGLLNAVVPADDVLTTALSWAGRILANGPLAVRATKESVVRGMKGTLRDAYKIESELSAQVFASEDAKEGPAAFAEKRPPRWQNR
jgi:enoyl-CoA hydratase